MINRGLHDLLLTLILGKHRKSIQAFQSRQLRRLVQHAYKRVPYYQELFDLNGIVPSDFRGLEDLYKIPITTKQQIRDLSETERLANNFKPDRLLKYSTSGSTGEPFSLRNSHLEEWIHALFRLRAHRSFGFRIPAKLARLRDPGLGCKSLFWRLIQVTGLYQIYELPTFPADEAVKKLRKIRPDSLAAYPGGAYYIARLLREEDRKVINLRWLTVGGADLLPIMRREIEAGFGTRLFETYACRETALIAWECGESGDLHVCDDHLIMEVVKDDGTPAGPGESGEVVVTVLHSFAQPFIRYRIHDIVTRGDDQCSCGLQYSTLRSIEGRTNDRIFFEGKPSLPPGPIFDFIEENANWIRQYQLIQEKLELVVLKLVLVDRPVHKELEILEKISREFLGPQIEFRIEFVDELFTKPGRKFRPSLCKVFDQENQMPPE